MEVWNIKSVQYPRFRWLVLLTIFLTSTASSMILISFAPLMGVIAKDMGIDLGSASFGFMGLHTLATAVGCVLAGFLLDRVGVFRVLIGSVLVLIISNASLAWVGHSYGAVVAIRIIEGFGCAQVVVAIGPVVALWFPRSEVGIANGFQSVAISLGIMIGLLLAPAFFQAAGTWQVGIAWLAAVLIVVLLIDIAVALHSKSHQPPAPPEVSEPSIPQEDYFKHAMRNPVFWVGMLTVMCSFWAQQAFNDLTPAYLAVAPPVGIGFGPMMAGKLFITVMISAMVGSLLGGTLIDRVFGGRSRPVILMGFALMAVFCTSIMFPLVYGNVLFLVLCLALAGWGPPFIFPSTVGHATKTFPASIVGKVIGLWMSVGLFGGAAGVMIGSIALRSTGNYHRSIIIVSVVSIIGFVVALFLKKPQVAESKSVPLSG